MRYLLDTNVVSESRKRNPDAAVARWREATPQSELCVSVLVLGELRRGIERLRAHDPLQARGLEQWFSSIGRQFAGRVLPVTLDVAEAWGRLRAPATLPVIDSLLAATAIVHGLTVVTRDTGPFEIAGVATLDPWAC